MPSVPQRGEHPVGQPEREQILDRLLPEVVVDAVDLLLGPVCEERTVERPGRVEVTAERLLDDDPPRSFHPRETGRVELLVDEREEVGGDGQIEEGVPRGADRRGGLVDEPSEPREGLRIVELTPHVVKAGFEPAPPFLVDGATRAEVPDVPALPRAELLRRHPVAPHPDDGKSIGEEPVAGEVEKCRHEQALREIAGGAENHEHAGGSGLSGRQGLGSRHR